MIMCGVTTGYPGHYNGYKTAKGRVGETGGFVLCAMSCLSVDLSHLSDMLWWIPSGGCIRPTDRYISALCEIDTTLVPAYPMCDT